MVVEGDAAWKLTLSGWVNIDPLPSTIWEVISMEEWAEIRRLHRPEGMSIKAIARKLHLARNTVRPAVRSTHRL